MPLKLQIAVNRKKGVPNYGSRGASVGLELELDAQLIRRPRELQSRIARLFRLAERSVAAELRRPLTNSPGPTAERTAHSVPRAPQPITSRQLQALRAIAAKLQVDLAAEVHSRFARDGLEQLTLDQASCLIDALQPQTNGAAHH